MRLPADAVLIVVEAQELIDPGPVAGHASKADDNIAALVAAWRAEGLALAHVGRCPPASSHAPPDGEIVVAGDATSAFVGTALEAGLDEIGATTLVVCGALATQALEASARHAADLGYQVFVVADACRAADASISVAGSGRLKMCGRWRWRVSARPPPSSTPRRRFGPRRRPRRASAELRERPDGAVHWGRHRWAGRLAPALSAASAHKWTRRSDLKAL